VRLRLVAIGARAVSHRLAEGEGGKAGAAGLISAGLRVRGGGLGQNEQAIERERQARPKDALGLLPYRP
jgi:hypothetical protein